MKIDTDLVIKIKDSTSEQRRKMIQVLESNGEQLCSGFNKNSFITKSSYANDDIMSSFRRFTIDKKWDRTSFTSNITIKAFLKRYSNLSTLPDLY